MKHASRSLLTLAAALGLASAAQAGDLVLAPVGPAPASSAANPTYGQLTVNSAYNVNAPPPSVPDYIRIHTDYDILTADGRLFQKVHNTTGTWGQDAVPVALPAGSYRVVARVKGYGVMTIPIVIRAREMTFLHLEGSTNWNEDKALASSNPVRLPNGRIIGWRAPQPAAP